MALTAQSSAGQVADWLAGLGSPLADYSDEFISGSVDGAMMETIDGFELSAMVGMPNEEHVTMVLSARDLAFSESAEAGGDAAVSPRETDHVLNTPLDAEATQVSPRDLEPEAEECKPLHPPLFQSVKRRDLAMVELMLTEGHDPNDPAEVSEPTAGVPIATLADGPQVSHRCRRTVLGGGAAHPASLRWDLRGQRRADARDSAGAVVAGAPSRGSQRQPTGRTGLQRAVLRGSQR
jgi:hypothetical protein